MSNQTKYSFYKKGFSLMQEALGNDQLQYTISAIAIAESVISDRMYSYLRFNDKKWLDKREKKGEFISCRDLTRKIDGTTKKVDLKVKTKKYGDFRTSNLFSEINLWLDNRNIVLHAFAKSSGIGKTKNVSQFKEFSFKTAQDGYKLARLLDKWVKKQN